MTDKDPVDDFLTDALRSLDFLKPPGPPVMRQTDRQTKPDQPEKAPARKRGGRPRKARGAATSTDKATARWTVRGVPVNVREIATKAAENRGMTVGDWISEAVVAFSKADANRVSADVPAVVTVDDMKDMKERLTKLESRDTQGWLGKLFGKSTMVALLLSVLLIGSGTARAVGVFGHGSQSCGAWTEAKENGEYTVRRQLFLTWVNGYLTAYSQWEDESGLVSSLPDAIGAHSWIDLYCQTDPTEAVADVVQRLIIWLEAH